MNKYFAPSELIINEDGSIFHLHVKPEQLADKVILVGDPGRVPTVASHFDTQECDISSREFRTITGTYKGKRITVVSTGIGCDNIDIVMNELDALANIDFNSKILLDQRKFMNRFDAIQSLLGLTDKEKAQILSINQSNDPSRKYKEVWIGLGGVQSAVYATEVSVPEYLAYTTEETEKVEVQRLAGELGGDIELAIRQLAEGKR